MEQKKSEKKGFWYDLGGFLLIAVILAAITKYWYVFAGVAAIYLVRAAWPYLVQLVQQIKQKRKEKNSDYE